MSCDLCFKRKNFFILLQWTMLGPREMAFQSAVYCVYGYIDNKALLNLDPWSCALCNAFNQHKWGGVLTSSFLFLSKCLWRVFLVLTYISEMINVAVYLVLSVCVVHRTFFSQAIDTHIRFLLSHLICRAAGTGVSLYVPNRLDLFWFVKHSKTDIFFLDLFLSGCSDLSM